jgi:hypothetical protein
MQATDWAPEHSDALREFLAKGMPYAKAADAINAKFGTAYTRNAAIGRGKRMGLAGPEKPKEPRRVPRRTSAPPGPCGPNRRGRSPCWCARTRQAPLRGGQTAPARAHRSRTRRLPLSLWRRQGRRCHHVLRPSEARGLKLLHAAFSSDARRRHRLGAISRSGSAAAGAGGLTATELEFARGASSGTHETQQIPPACQST